LHRLFYPFFETIDHGSATSEDNVSEELDSDLSIASHNCFEEAFMDTIYIFKAFCLVGLKEKLRYSH
jgi:hypothetical protein